MTTRRSSRRQKQAAATRQDILAAARKLFAERGYAATSMAAIAERADTAVQTIYDSVGSKPAIILALVDVIEEEAGVGAFVERFRQTRDPRELIELQVGLTRQFIERTGDVVAAMMSAAPSEPDVAEAWRKGNRNHRGGAHQVAQALARLGALKPGLAVERAGDVISVLTWGTTWLQLIDDHGWSLDECGAWMTETLVTLLLRDAA